MKTRLSIILSILLFGILDMAADTPYVYVYRNDSAFHYLDVTRPLQFSYSSMTADSTRQLVIIRPEDSDSMFVPFDAVDSIRLANKAIPDIYINLTEEPELTDLIRQRGKSYIYPAKLRMDGHGAYDDIEELDVEFRGRGNSTWWMPKLPYRFKMAKKRSVCGLPKAKTFALLANFIDGSHARNFFALRAAQMLEMPYTNHAIPVRVHLNGHTKGLYMLTEKIGIGSGSVDIDEEKGMLFELDIALDEDYNHIYKWIAGNSEYLLPVMVKDPDINEIAEGRGINPNEYWLKWRDDFSAFADSITSSTPDSDLSSVLDIDSAVNYFLVYNISGNSEITHPKSVYMHKDSIDDVYHFGPVWDFDWAYTYSRGTGTQSANFILLNPYGEMDGKHFFRIIVRNKEFQKRFGERWNYFKTECYPRLLEELDEYAELIRPAAYEDGYIWKDGHISYGDGEPTSLHHKKRIDELKAWLKRRVSYISAAVNYALAPRY
ncbi:MAG: CotH kinase family protein [Muribaculaceae bacterium]|nr:CotH kinase family protein [Muribaculaceae bacterium]